MNPWFDRGLFCIVWVGCTWVADTLMGGTGKTSFFAMLLGASSIALVGLIIQAFTNTRKWQ